MNKTLLAITFYERKNYLPRILNYYNQFKDDLDIIILDQSKKTWENPQHPKVQRWHHFPSDRFNFYEMWDEVCKIYTKHEFIYWNNDDDFAVPSGIKMAEEFLLSNPAYSLAQGQVVQLDGSSSQLTSYGQGEWFKKDCAQSIVEDRLASVFDKAYVNPHTTIRKTSWHKAIKLVLRSVKTNSSLAPIKFWDKIVTFVSAVDGYRKTDLPCITAIRTHRDSTGSLLEKVEEYPIVLERHTEYSEILGRLRSSDPLSYLLSEAGCDLEPEQAHELVVHLMNPKNIDFAKAPKDKLHMLPARQEYGQEEIRAALNTIL